MHNPPKRHQPPTRNPPKRNRRGGAYVPARTSAQRRFHTKNTRMVREEFNDGCAFVGRLGRAHRHRPYQTPLYFSTQSHTNKITICTQSTQTKSTIPRTSRPNETVGAAPACPPERPCSGVSIPKIHVLCAGILATDAPLQGDAGGHTGTAPTNFHHIFPRIPHKQNNHLHTILPNDINPPKRNA